MKRIAIWGAGKVGKSLKEEGQLLDDEQFVCFVDNRLRNDMDFPILAPDVFARRFGNEIDAVLVAVSNYYDLGDILFQLHDLGIHNNVFALKTEDWEKRSIDLCAVNRYLWGGNIADKALITKLEFHVCDHCNLNCAGCSHFAPIFKENFADVDRFKCDVNRLAKDYYILRFRLMGGEPFLNNELPRFVEIARRYLPHSRIEIVTNGLLLLTVPKTVIECIRENNVFLNISLYPPTYALREKISCLLEQSGVGFSFGSGLKQYNELGVIEEFHQCFTESKTHDGRIAAKHCFGSECHYLRDGKISKCALPLLVEDINRVFDKNFEVSSEDYIDIYSDTVSPWDKVKRLREGTPFCAYCCESGRRRFPWHIKSEVDFDDYVIPVSQ